MTTTTSTPNTGHAKPIRAQCDRPRTCRYRVACLPRVDRITRAHRAAPPPTTHAHATQLRMYTCRHRRP